jgi:predicted nuclease with RNAse H fold
MSKETKPCPWHRIIIDCAAQLRKHHGRIERSVAQRMSRLLLASLVPRRTPGRKPTRAVQVAVRLRSRGVSWNSVYPRAIAGYQDLPWYLQSVRKHNLRRAVRAWQRRRETDASRNRPE